MANDPLWGDDGATSAQWLINTSVHDFSSCQMGSQATIDWLDSPQISIFGFQALTLSLKLLLCFVRSDGMHVHWHYTKQAHVTVVDLKREIPRLQQTIWHQNVHLAGYFLSFLKGSVLLWGERTMEFHTNGGSLFESKAQDSRSRTTKALVWWYIFGKYTSDIMVLPRHLFEETVFIVVPDSWPIIKTH